MFENMSPGIDLAAAISLTADALGYSDWAAIAAGLTQCWEARATGDEALLTEAFRAGEEVYGKIFNGWAEMMFHACSGDNDFRLMIEEFNAM